MGATMTRERYAPLLSTSRIPSTVRCLRCGELAHAEVRERVADNEVMVRYGCETCRWHQTRHFNDGDLGLRS